MSARRRKGWMALAGLGLLFCSVDTCQKRPAASLRARVIAVLRGARPIAGRLSGLPFRSQGALQGSTRELGKLLRELHRQDTADALAARGVLALAGSGQLDRAIDLLERAHELAPKEATIASDLAAAFLARGGSENLRDLLGALDTARAAVDLSPQMPEARFNLALALDRLFLTDEARQAWQAFLACDSRSGWAREARARLRYLEESPERHWLRAKEDLEKAALVGDLRQVDSIFAAHRLRARLYCELTLLERWARAQEAGAMAEARTALAEARTIGRAYAEVARDDLFRDAVAAIDHGAGKPEHLAWLAAGHRAYAEAMRAYQQYDRMRAATLFALAERDLQRAGSPFHLLAALFAAACEYQGNGYDRTLADLQDVEERAAGRRYPSLVSRAKWIRGLVQAILEQPLAARENYLAALAGFRWTGELGYQAVVQGLLFDVESFLGEEKDGGRHLYQALALASDLDDARSRQVIAFFGTQASLDAGLPRAGLYFQGEAVRSALASGNAVQIAIALRDRASLDLLAARMSEGKRDLAAAKDWAGRAQDMGLSAEIRVLEARMLASEDLSAALASLVSALPALVATHDVRRVAASYLLRGRLYVRVREPLLARADFIAGMHQIEQTFGELDDTSRLSYFDHVSELFDELVALEAAQEPELGAKAFEYADRGRGRALVELLRDVPHAVGSIDLASMERRLPFDRALVEYSVLPDRLLGWVVAAGRARTFSVRIGAEEFERRVLRWRAAILDGQGSQAEAEALYRILIEPLRLPASARLVIVPDKGLCKLPFGALRNPQNAHYLIEDHALEWAPSSAFYFSPERGRKLARAQDGRSVLVVADPAFDPSLANGLSRLPGAAVEGAKVVQFYRKSVLLTGEAATKQRVLEIMGGYNVVHFGTHAEMGGRSKLYSRLFLAPTAADHGILFAKELYGRSFPLTELVVLAACDSASGQVAGSEGVSSLARPFLAAGVPRVIGNLWALDDRVAAQFDVELHRRLAAGVEPTDALQKAEVAMIRSLSLDLKRPRFWAGFTLYATCGAPCAEHAIPP